MRHAVLTPFFGRLRDRFCEYHSPLPLAEKIRLAAAIPGVKGVEFVYPDECSEPAEIQPLLSESGLEVAAVNVNLKGERVFQTGALSSADSGVRGRAVELLREGKQLASSLGAGRITCAPLADGYDYPFHIGYGPAWTRMVDAIAEAAESLPEIVLHIEHKPAEPRTRGLLHTSTDVLRLCRDAAVPGLGVTFNAGHAMYDGRSPAAHFCEVLGSRLPYYIHFCDATTAWDWDLIAGSHQLWQWAEFLFHLRQAGYDDWLTADTFPVRQDASALFSANIALTDRICQWLDRLDNECTWASLDAHQLGPALREFEQCIPQRT